MSRDRPGIIRFRDLDEFCIDGRLLAYKPKKRQDALVDAALSKKGVVNDPKLVSISIARAINLKSGGVVITPWQVDELDDDWLDAFLTEAPSSIEKHNRTIDERRAAFYAKHTRH